MCGIVGIVKFDRGARAPWHAPRRDFSALDAMSAAIAHRGPDGSGVFTDPRPDKIAALVHRRLAIIDLPGGTQPMPNEDGRVQVVFNGEIYNHAALRGELQAAGHAFRSDHSDTEVLVHGWEQWGEGLPARLTGMFAFAIWDMRLAADGVARDVLFLARDRMGQKPLFYATLEDGIVFGSTIRSVLAWPEVPRRVPQEQVALYLQLGYLPPPFTIWRDVSQVIPGHWVRLRRDVLDGGRYWSPIPRSVQTENRKSKVDGSPAALAAALSDAVESQMVADVPIACFLSGGIDSSIIALLMQRAVARQGGKAIKTVSVGFAESAFDETQHAAAVARQIGSSHTRLEVNAAQDVIGTLAMLTDTVLGQPFGDSSILPTYHLSKAVRQLAPVALAGDGGDELFGGYDRYRAMTLLERWSAVARLMPRAAPVGSLGKRERYRRLAEAARATDRAERYTRLEELFSPEQLAALIDETFNYQPPGLPEASSPFRHALFRDQLEYLPGDLLYKVDSASMCEALEVRAPFLDHALVELANALPDAALLRGGQSKAILREAFAKDLPAEILTRPKQGFAVPIGTWFRGMLREPLTGLLTAPNSLAARVLHTPAVRRLLDEHQTGARDHTHRLFALLMLELWWKNAGATIE